MASDAMTSAGVVPAGSANDGLNQTVIVAVPAFLIRFGAMQGMALESLLQEAKLTLADLGDLDRRVGYESLYGVWKALRKTFPDKPLCMDVARAFDFSVAGVVGALVRCSDTLGQGLERVLRYQRYFDPAVDYRFERDGEKGRVVVVPDAGLRAYPYPLETIVGLMVASARLLTREPLPLRAVGFEYGAHHELEHYEAFFGCEVRFGETETAVEFDLEALDAAVVSADPHTARYLEELAERLVSEVPSPPEPSFKAEVRGVIRGLLTDGQPSQGQVAKRLAVSVRTLQRRLQEAGTSFAEVQDEVMKDVACALLRDRKYLIADVAFVLGYAEPSSFYRAFKRWMGCTPEQFRHTPALTA